MDSAPRHVDGHPFRLSGSIPLPVDPRTIRNKLLAGLNPGSLALLAPHLQRVFLRQRQVLVEPQVPVREVFFIETGVASVISRIKQDRGSEITMVGCMGVVGLPAVLGTCTSPFRCVVQIPGLALRMSADDLRGAIDEIPGVGQQLMNYVQAAMIQQAQITVCNSKHRVEQRVARWLLMGMDRIDGSTLPITHGLLSRVLGVRRASVTLTIQALERAGIIRHGRGQLTVADRDGLRHVACDCCGFIKREYDRLICSPAGLSLEGSRGQHVQRSTGSDRSYQSPSVG
jgi:CRP-like cAMP-binding protein